MVSGLKVKTSFLETLPFLLGGLAHSDPAVSSNIARRALDVWAATPEAQREAHHRFTRRFFQDEAMRADLRRHGEGVAFDT